MFNQPIERSLLHWLLRIFDNVFNRVIYDFVSETIVGLCSFQTSETCALEATFTFVEEVRFVSLEY